MLFISAEVSLLIKIKCNLETKPLLYLASYSLTYLVRSLHDGLRLYSTDEQEQAYRGVFAGLNSSIERIL